MNFSFFLSASTHRPIALHFLIDVVRIVVAVGICAGDRPIALHFLINVIWIVVAVGICAGDRTITLHFLIDVVRIVVAVGICAGDRETRRLHNLDSIYRYAIVLKVKVVVDVAGNGDVLVVEVLGNRDSRVAKSEKSVSVGNEDVVNL